MQNQTDVRPVHPHTKCHRGHQHRILRSQEMLQRSMSNFRFKTGVIGDGLNPVGTESLCPTLHRNTGAGVNQTSATGILQRINHILQRIPNPAAHGVVEVVTSGRSDLNQRPPEMQKPKNICSDPGGCRGTERHQRNTWAKGSQLTQPAVIRAEVMAPSADAVSLIDSERHQLSCSGVLLQNGTGGCTLQTLRCEIQQPQGSVAELRKRLSPLNWINASMQTGRCDASTSQLENLIFHQSHQRRDHHHEP